jgi:hypothetical protein
LLKIPVSGDRLPPLVMPTRAASPEAGDESGEGSRRKRKRKSRRSGGAQEWERELRNSHGPRKGDKRQMVWMLAGGGVLFILVLVGVVVAMLGGGKTVPKAADNAAPAGQIAPRVAVAPAKPERSDAARLADAEPVIRGFLEARHVEDLLPLVRNPATAGPRMRSHYGGDSIDAPGLSEVVAARGLSRIGEVFTVSVRTRTHEEKAIAFEETADGVRIDWESWAGWSEMPWDVFMAEKPTSPKLFRVNLDMVDYYNFAFADDRKWQSYRLISPDGEHALYGYVEKGTVLDSRLKPPPDTKSVPLTLSLKFPENATAANQVLIDALLADGWVIDSETKP